MADIYFLLNNFGIGGAEKRMLRVASRIAQQQYKAFENVFLLINHGLWDEYNCDQNLLTLYKSSGLQLKLLPDTKELPLWVRIMNKLAQKIKIPAFINYAKFQYLKEKSYFTELLHMTRKGDTIHTFFGDESRNGAFLVAHYGRKVIIEITSNRHLEKINTHLDILLQFKKSSSSLHIRCISNTVYTNLLNALTSICVSRLSDVAPYPFTYIEPFGENKLADYKKQNLIVFGHRFVSAKNPLLFAEIVKEMCSDGQLHGWKVLFRGKGDSIENDLRNMLKMEMETGVVDIGYSRAFSKELRTTKIFVSIIGTGNYPSQSVLEAMQAGNLLLLSNTGQTKEKFFHEEICFPELNKNAIKKSLLDLMAVAESDNFPSVSMSMVELYKEIAQRDEYIQSLMDIYKKPF